MSGLGPAAVSPFEGLAAGDQVKPFLKWAGGKGQLVRFLLPAIREGVRLTQGTAAYCEPFLGGGSVFTATARAGITFRSVTLNDSNTHLVNTYRVVRDEPNTLIETLANLEQRYNVDDDQERRAEMYYSYRQHYNELWRAGSPSDTVQAAALLVFLNKTAFNGLFRLNQTGKFNAPHGRHRRPLICARERILALSRVLKGARILSLDFPCVTREVERGTVVYLDPPYIPLSQTASFTGYTAVGFNGDRQAELAAEFRRMADIGAFAIASNSSAPESIRLYGSVGANVYLVPAKRAINSNASARGAIDELIATNFEVPGLEIFRAIKGKSAKWLGT